MLYALRLWPVLLVLAFFNLALHRATLAPDRIGELHRDELLHHSWASLMLAAPVSLELLRNRSDVTLSRLPRVPPAGKHLLPYRDFVFEYPPLALVPIVLAGLVTTDVALYPYAFASLCALAALAMVLAGRQVARSLERESGGSRHARFARRYVTASAIALLLVGVTIETRLDVFATAAAAGALWAAVTGRFALCGALCGVGAGVNLYPGLLWPALVAPLAAQGRWRDLGKSLAALLGVLLVTCALPYLMSSTGFSGALGLHLRRGLQVESVGASLLSSFGLVTGQPYHSAHGFGSMELIGRAPQLCATISRVLLPLFAGGAALLCWVAARTRGPRGGRTLLVDGMATAVAGLWVASPVLSPPYLIWGLPLLPMVSSAPARVLYFLALAITRLEFPGHWGLVSNLAPGGIAIVAVRNALVVAIWLVLVARLLEHCKRPTP